ncbi:PLAC8 family-domain-containing protein [Cladorrhinum samala]|uniref:PLAC8 family-domain-containing protein n=1 Tax=Cladorrhinum samala TaxID=585594 RepID=A0AAV9HCK7_9PEZI|nr:PLAC8 family-domain-containing protein [Cladorrhinum samala]
MAEPIKNGEWQDGLLSCCSGGHALMGCCCPCVLVNKTHELLENPNNPEPKACGLWGCGWCLLNACGGWGFILNCLQRGEIRKKHNIEGNGCGDFCVSLCCPCCGTIQQYKELEQRRDAQGLPDKVGYQGQTPMGVPR